MGEGRFESSLNIYSRALRTMEQLIFAKVVLASAPFIQLNSQMVLIQNHVPTPCTQSTFIHQGTTHLFTLSFIHSVQGHKGTEHPLQPGFEDDRALI